MNNFSFLKEETFGLRTQLTYTGNKLEIFLPESYIGEGSMARQLGEYIESIGIFLFKENNELYELSFPIKFQFAFTSKYKWTGKLKPELNEDTYNVFVLEKNDAFCYDINHREDSTDIVFFISKLIEAGKLPEIISYDNILPLLLNAMMVANSINMGVSAMTYELLISELCRNKFNLSEPFRFYLNKYPNKIYDYKRVKITKLPELTSTFTGIMGEDSKQQIATAIAYNRSGRKERESPIEKLIKY